MSKRWLKTQPTCVMIINSWEFKNSVLKFN